MAEGESTNIEMVNVKIDGKDYQFPKGTNLLDACLAADRPGEDYPDQNRGGEHYVPHFCYHPGLSVSGNCRMCFVKTKQMVKRGDKVIPMEMATTSCTNVVAEGLEVDTKGEEVLKIRAGIMDLELINHPLDCPECDKSGECALQDYAFDYGHADSKFDFEKTKAHIKPLGDKITIWGTRCIQCSRCIRVADEITGTSELCFINRGDLTVIDVFPGQPIDNPLALNTVEVCPVGALKNRDFLYTARVWNLEEMPGVCGLCAKGCASRVDSLKGEVTRVMSGENTNVNDYWVCDRGRTDFKWINSPKRIDEPLTKKGHVRWDSGYDRAVEGLKKLADNKTDSWAIANAHMTNEELFLFKRLVKDNLGIDNVAVLAAPDVEAYDFPKFKSPADGNPNRNGVNVILGIDNAEASITKFVEAANAGKAKHVFVWSGLPHGMDHHDEFVKALGAEAVESIVAVDFQSSILSELADVTLASTSWYETAGSWINHEWRLQAFRAAMPHPRAGATGVEILQNVLHRMAPQEADSTATEAGVTTPGGVGSAEYRSHSEQRADGSATIAVMDKSGEMATKSKVRVVSPAAIFDEMADSVTQFNGQSHLKLIQSKGTPLM